MSEVMNVGVMNVWFWVGGDESPRWWMSEFSQGVMNVWGDECRGDECRTIDILKHIFPDSSLRTILQQHVEFFLSQVPTLERINQNSKQYFLLMICKHPNFRAVCRSPHWITEQNRLCINIYATGCTTLAWHTIQSSSIFHWFVFLLLVAELQFSKLFVCLIVWTGAKSSSLGSKNSVISQGPWLKEGE